MGMDMANPSAVPRASIFSGAGHTEGAARVSPTAPGRQSDMCSMEEEAPNMRTDVRDDERMASSIVGDSNTTISGASHPGAESASSAARRMAAESKERSSIPSGFWQKTHEASEKCDSPQYVKSPRHSQRKDGARAAAALLRQKRNAAQKGARSDSSPGGLFSNWERRERQTGSLFAQAEARAAEESLSNTMQAVLHPDAEGLVMDTDEHAVMRSASSGTMSMYWA